MSVIPGMGAAIDVQKLRVYARMVAATLDSIAEQHPDLMVVRNEVGNLALLLDREYVGYVNLFGGEVRFFPDEEPAEV